MTRLFALIILGLAVASSPNPARAQQPQPGVATDKEDLLVGPRQGVVEVKNLAGDAFQKKEVCLLFVTKSRVVYAEKEGGSPVVAPYVRSVETKDGKNSWVWGKAGGLVGDPVLPGPINVSPYPFPTDKYGLYLLVTAETFHDEFNEALWSPNTNRVKALLAYAGKLSEFAKTKKLPPSVTDLFALDKYAEVQRSRVEEVLEGWNDLIDIDASRADLLAAADQRAAGQLAVGNGVMALGGLLAVLSEGEHGWDAVASGLDLVAASSLAHARRRAMIDSAAKVSKKEVRDRMEKQLSDFENSRKQLRALLLVAVKALDLKEPDLFDPTRLAQLIQDRKTREAIQLLEKRAASLKANGVTHPLLLTRIAQFEGALLDQPGKDHLKRSADIFAWAEKSLDAVRWVPEGELFHLDRVRALTATGELTHRAVAVAHGPLNWSKCYDPRADFGVRVLNHACSYGAEYDPDGSARALRAWLLFQRGLWELALRQGQEVADSRRWDPVTQYNMARLYGKASEFDDAARKANLPRAEKCLHDAFRAGHPDVRNANRDIDLTPLKGSALLWKYLTNPQLTATLEVTLVGKGQGNYNLGIENKSPFPITDATLSFTFKVQGTGKTLTASRRVDYLAPGSTLVWKDVVTGSVVNGTSTLLLNSPNLSWKDFSVPVGQGAIRFYDRGVPILEARDPFRNGAEFTGERTFANNKKSQKWELVLTSRDKATFTGKITLEDGRTYNVEGTTEGKAVHFKTVRQKKDQFDQSFKGKWVNGKIEGDFNGVAGNGAKVSGTTTLAPKR